MTESPFMRRVLNSAHTAGMWLFRNNVGLFYTRDQRPVRCGLATGSSDLIGWTEYTITDADVGRVVAIFTAVETKSARGTLTQDQRNFINAVRRSGGIADRIRANENITETLAALAANGGRNE